MTNSPRLRVWFLLFVSLCVFCAHSPGAEQKPNLVVFLSDDHGLLDSTPYGATDVRTPNMQRLAAEGMTFTHAFIASPACAPSRTAMLTGLMPVRNGAEANHTFKREGLRSLPENLVKLGYAVAAFGKVAHGKDVTRHGFTHHDNQMRAQLEAWMKSQGDQRTVFQEPRLLSEPASYAPVTNSPAATNASGATARRKPIAEHKAEACTMLIVNSFKDAQK